MANWMVRWWANCIMELRIVALLAIVVSVVVGVGVKLASDEVIKMSQSEIGAESKDYLDIIELIVVDSFSNGPNGYLVLDSDGLNGMLDKFGHISKISEINFRYANSAVAFEQKHDVPLTAPKLFSKQFGLDPIQFSKPVFIAEQYIGLLLIKVSPNEAINEAWAGHLSTLRLVLLSLIAVVIAIIFVVRKSIRPLSVLVKASAQAEKGMYSVKIPIAGSPEIRQVLTAYSSMADSVNASMSALKESELRSRQLLDSLPQLVWTCGPDGMCDYLNHNWIVFTGLSASEQLGLKWMECVHPEDYAHTRSQWKDAFLNNTDMRIEYRIRRYDGQYRWFDVQATLLRDKQSGSVKWFGSNTDITERKMAEMDLRRSQQKLQMALEGSSLGFWDRDIQNGTIQCSGIWAQLLGYGTDPIEFTLQEWQDLYHPEDREAVTKSIQSNLFGATLQHNAAFRIRCKNGDYKWVLDSAKIVARDSNGQPARIVGMHADITAQKAVEAELKIAATAFESQEGMMITDAEKRILRVNKAFERITGFELKDVVGKTPAVLRSHRHKDEFYIEMWKEINDKGAWEGEVWNKKKGGSIYPQHLTVTAVSDSFGTVVNYVGAFIDLSDSKAATEKIMKLAFYDPLTQLPNRRLLSERLNQALASALRHKQVGAVLFLDLDNFKILNDTLGHDVGDLLLQQVGDRIKSCVRENDIVARFGGDEFVIVLEQLSVVSVDAAKRADLIGDKILEVLQTPYQLNDHLYSCSVSIGVALFGGEGTGDLSIGDPLDDLSHQRAHESMVHNLLRNADIAMYNAKQTTGGSLRFFDPNMQEKINARVALEADLNDALTYQQFQLHYQIQIDAEGKPQGAEALIRWAHPVRGMVPPLDFIPVAEETDLIVPIGDWVISEACAQLKSWQNDPILCHLSVSVNVSSKQLRHPKFVEKVNLIVRQHDIDPKLLNFEITESMLLKDLDLVIERMESLISIGIKFELDDFGTGFSSLQYLKHLPIHRLKIDRSFVSDIADNKSDLSIVKTIITMARHLELEVIAEGVETEEQRRLLIQHGCEHFQGYLFGKPIAHEDFENSVQLIQKNVAQVAQ